MVLRAIKNIECSEVFDASNFAVGSYLDKNKQQRPGYDITESGFMYLVTGFISKKGRWMK